MKVRSYTVTIIYIGIPLAPVWSSIKCLCFTAMKCRSGTHFMEGQKALCKMPLQISILSHFMESFLPSIKDYREMQDVASEGCIL